MHDMQLKVHTCPILTPDEIARLERSFRDTLPVALRTHIAGYDPEKSERNIVVSQHDSPILRMYMLDATIDTPDDNLTEVLTESIGLLWMEWVRTFVYSGAIIVFRLSTKTKHLIWTPHGR